MADPAVLPSRWFSRFAYVATVMITAAATFGVILLWQNVAERKEEARQTVFRLVDLTEDTIDPAEWGKNFPRQYDSYLRTADNERPHEAGSEGPPSKLDADPRLRLLYQGYPFAVDYREKRGHAHMLEDQDATERVKQFKQPGACLHCHAAILPAYRAAGRQAGVPDGQLREQIHKGFEVFCPLPLKGVRTKVSHPVTCLDCHDPQSLGLRVTRPAFQDAIEVLATSTDPVAHLPSIGHWRKGARAKPYDVNAEASRQELRSLVCAQCHVEYYFKGPGKLVTYPWHKGLQVEQMEAYYDEIGFTDWTHAVAGTKMLKAQHPEFELWSQGIHARSGVACADCHMPYVREGAIKVSDHHVRSPLLNVARACQTCHRYPEAEILARAEAIQHRTLGLKDRAENAVVDLIEAIAAAAKAGASDDQLKPCRALHRQAQWRLDFVISENSRGFHAPQESARVLAEAIDLARQGQVAATKIPAGR